MITSNGIDAKSKSNREKHGVSFDQARSVWNDPERVEIEARTQEDELRYLVIGVLEPKVYAIVITYRSQRVRIISARRAREKEIIIYEENKAK